MPAKPKPSISALLGSGTAATAVRVKKEEEAQSAMVSPEQVVGAGKTTYVDIGLPAALKPLTPSDSPDRKTRRCRAQQRRCWG